jgi:hypothetical protein
VALRTPPPKPGIKIPTKGNLRESTPRDIGDYVDRLHPELVKIGRAMDAHADFLQSQAAGFAQETTAANGDVYAKVLALIGLCGKGVI